MKSLGPQNLNWMSYSNFSKKSQILDFSRKNASMLSKKKSKLCLQNNSFIFIFNFGLSGNCNIIKLYWIWLMTSMKVIPPVFCYFRGCPLSSTFHENHLKWLKRWFFVPLLIKWLKMANLGHFQWFLWKVEESWPPLKRQNTLNMKINQFKIYFKA